MTIDALTASALWVESLVEGAGAIKLHAHESPALPIDILFTADAFGKLDVVAAFSCSSWQEQGALEPLRTIAVGVSKLKSGMHSQASRTAWYPIRITLKDRVAMLIFRHSSNAAMTGGLLIDIPGITGGVSGQMRRKLRKRDHCLLIERAKIGDIAFLERLGIFGKHHIAVVWGRSSRHPSAIAPDELFLLFGAPIGLFLVGTALDAKFAIGITSGIRVLS